MAERFFEKVLSDVRKATEQITNSFDVGLGILFEATTTTEQQHHSTIHDADHIQDGIDESDLEEELQNNPLQGITEGVLGNIMRGQLQPESLLDQFNAFRSAITWKEPFILSLIVFQIIMFALCLYISRPGRGVLPRLIYMFTIAVLVRSSEWINAHAANHWKQFCTQNYFDARGVFMMVMVCLPLLLDSLIMLLFIMKEASRLLVQVKTAQLKQKQRQQSKANKGDGTKAELKKDQ